MPQKPEHFEYKYHLSDLFCRQKPLFKKKKKEKRNSFIILVNNNLVFMLLINQSEKNMNTASVYDFKRMQVRNQVQRENVVLYI